MSAILAIESSTSAGSIAIRHGVAPATQREFQSDRLHHSNLFRPLGELLNAGTPPDLVVVGTGPGSYTGVRTGIATALGLSLAREIPLIGIPSICAFQEAPDPEMYVVTGDARRGAWWYAEVNEGRLVHVPVVDDAETIAGMLARWNGRVFTMDRVSPPFCQAVSAHPAAAVLAERAAALSAAEIANLSQAVTEPLYLRAPYITKPGEPVIAGGDQRLNDGRG